MLTHHTFCSLHSMIPAPVADAPAVEAAAPAPAVEAAAPTPAEPVAGKYLFRGLNFAA